MKHLVPLLSLSLSLALAGCATLPPPPAAPPVAGLQQAWVQAVAGPAWAVRALTAEPSCPRLQWAGGSTPMQQRAAPGEAPPPPGNPQAAAPQTRFALRACEAPWPAGATRVQVGAVTLRAPAAEMRRIAVIGDTGCRLKAASNDYQGCNDAADWPFPRVLAQVLAMKPDLVIHVGDYHYRESPCPAGMASCAGSPWGYGDSTWQADFFKPAQALLAAAPWVFVRGNHEACARAGQGWLRYLDPESGPARACAAQGEFNDGDFTAPYAVPLSPRSQLIVFDSSAVGSRTPPRGSAAWTRWREQLDRVADLSRDRAQSLFASHHPSLAFDPTPQGAPKTVQSGLTPLLQDQAPERLFPPGIQATLHGHLHVHEALGFASNHPATLVIGNGGSASSGRVDAAAALKHMLLPGARLETVDVHSEFGFSVLSATPEGWTLDAFNALGQPVASCSLAGQKLRC